MSICWIRCVQTDPKSDSERTCSTCRSFSKDTVSHLGGHSGEARNVNNRTEGHLDNSSLNSVANTTSGVNWSNITDLDHHHQQQPLLESQPSFKSGSSFNWMPEAKQTLELGHTCIKEDPRLNEKILHQRIKAKIKKTFTPPPFNNTGIEVCPNPAEDVRPTASLLKKKPSSVLDDDFMYRTPGNMEFIDFCYPKIVNLYRYTTYALPESVQRWEWLYDHIKNIRNSFRRKYRAEVNLSLDPIPYKGHRVYAVKIESHTQFNVLRCRSGLPQSLQKILFEAPNAHIDVNCYVTEYLVKRKTVFNRPNDTYEGAATQQTEDSRGGRPSAQVKDGDPSQHPSTASPQQEMQMQHSNPNLFQKPAYLARQSSTDARHRFKRQMSRRRHERHRFRGGSSQSKHPEMNPLMKTFSN